MNQRETPGMWPPHSGTPANGAGETRIRNRQNLPMPELSSFRRIVVKIGSSLLVDQAKGSLRRAWLMSLVDDLARHAARGGQIVVVSSGAIALGRTILKLPRGPLALEASQAAASVGQVALAQAWAE